MYTLTPKLLMWMSAAGLMGDGLRDVFAGVSEYDLTNYIIIPLGLTKSGKSVYFRVPTDETSRLLGGIAWKMFNHKKLGGMDFQTGLFDYMAGQAPTVGPFFGIASDAAAMSRTGIRPRCMPGRPARPRPSGRSRIARIAWNTSDRPRSEPRRLQHSVQLHQHLFLAT